VTPHPIPNTSIAAIGVVRWLIARLVDTLEGAVICSDEVFGGHGLRRVTGWSDPSILARRVSGKRALLPEDMAA
jgi:hypothetical protein